MIICFFYHRYVPLSKLNARSRKPTLTTLVPIFACWKLVASLAVGKLEWYFCSILKFGYVKSNVTRHDKCCEMRQDINFNRLTNICLILTIHSYIVTRLWGFLLIKTLNIFYIKYLLQVGMKPPINAICANVLRNCGLRRDFV